MGHSWPLFIYLFRLFNTVQSKQVNKCSILILPMTGFEPRPSGIGSDCSTNWATTTSQPVNSYLCICFATKLVKLEMPLGYSGLSSKRFLIHCLLVMGGDSCSKGRGFESQHCILDGHFFTLICCKTCNDVCLKRPKINDKRGRGLFLKNAFWS